MSWFDGGDISTEQTADNRGRPRGGSSLPRRGKLGKVVAVGIVGAAVGASSLLASGAASATSPVVVDTCTESAQSTSYGQPIVASPKALDATLEDAALLVYPFQFDKANQIRERFLATDNVHLGTVTEKEQEFSGSEIIAALKPNIKGLSILGDKADSVLFHLRNLAVLGCLGGVEVPGQEKPAGSPDQGSQQSHQGSQQSHQGNQLTLAPPQQGGSGQPAQSGGDSETTANSQSQSSSSNRYSTPTQAERVVPQDYTYVPGSLPPWSETRYGKAPSETPKIGDLTYGEDAKQKKVQRAGSAQPLPTSTSDRVALPVLMAAICLAGVMSVLIRTWVLRRS